MSVAIQHHPRPRTILYPVKDVPQVNLGGAVSGLIVGNYHKSPVFVEPKLDPWLIPIGANANHIGHFTLVRNIIRFAVGRARHGKNLGTTGLVGNPTTPSGMWS